jgi:hypothetical protein
MLSILRVSVPRVRVYLSGGMEHARDFGAGWRKELQRWLETELGQKVFNPAEVSREYLRRHYPGMNQNRMKRTDMKKFKRLVSALMRLDCREIATRSDYVICFWDRSAQQGAGTKGELTMAKYFGKPVYMVTKMDPVDIPGWVLACTTMMFKNFDDVKMFLKERFNRMSGPAKEN